MIRLARNTFALALACASLWTGGVSLPAFAANAANAAARNATNAAQRPAANNPQRSTSAGTVWKNDPNAVVREVLAQPGYAAAKPTSAVEPKPSLWDQFWNWVGKQLKKLLGPIGGAISHSAKVGTVVGVVLSVAAVLGLIFVIVRLVLAFAGPKRLSAGAGFTGRALGGRESAAEWRALAKKLAASGDYARAVAALFRAALSALDERALVPYDASRTPGEYGRLVRRALPAAAPPFEDLSAGFVRAAYSDRPAARDDFERAERALATFEPLVAAP